MRKFMCDERIKPVNAAECQRHRIAFPDLAILRADDGNGHSAAFFILILMRKSAVIEERGQYDARIAQGLADIAFQRTRNSCDDGRGFLSHSLISGHVAVIKAIKFARR